MTDTKQERVRYTVTHAYEHSPFYRERMDAHGIAPEDIEDVDDLSRLPIVDKEDILANQPPATEEYRLRNPDADVRRPFNTSGTTGDPKTIFKSYDEVDAVYDDVRRGHEHFGMTPDDTVINYFPFVGLNVSGFGTEGGMERLGAETVPLSNTPYPVDVEAELLQRHRPEDGNYVMMGLASHIDAKGMQFQEEGYSLDQFDIDMILLAGEPVTEARKEHIAALYDADVYEYLGSTEGGAFAYDCLEGDGLHVLDDRVHVEVVDSDTGEALPHGEEGSLLITNLLAPGEESGMPLLRYALGDLVTAYDEGNGCDCMLSGHPRISTPRRDSNGFILGAVNLEPSYFEERIYAEDALAGAVTDYQLQVDYNPALGKDVLEVQVATNGDGHTGLVAEDVGLTVDGSRDNPAAELGRTFLEDNPHLTDTVDTVGAARIDVRFVDAIEHGPGKPERLIDAR